MRKINGNLVICLLFLLIVFGIGIGTVYQARTDLAALADSDGQSVSVSEVEALLDGSLYQKDTLITFNGITQQLMGRSLVGDGQFYRDSQGLMHLSREFPAADKLLETTKYLADVFSARSTPFMVCQIAERATHGDEFSLRIDHSSMEYIQPLKQMLSETDAIYLDYDSIFAEAGLSDKDVFFKTDIHFTTQAEFCVVQKIVETLEAQAGLSFRNKDTALNLDNYATESYPFWGNLFDSVGRFYAGTDQFVYYIPKFETSMHLYNPVMSVERHGSFETVCLNNCRSLFSPKDRVYRITDYMQWPSPSYRITNDLVAENDVLLIGCSMSMRTMAYMSLLCKSVTVLDPRYFENVDYMKEALESDYDAVILFPSCTLLTGVCGYDAQPESCRMEQNDNGTFDLYVEARNSGTTAWKEQEQIKLSLLVNGQDALLRAELPPDASVPPQGTYTFVFKDLSNALTASPLSVQLFREGAFFFGAQLPIQQPDFYSADWLDAQIISHTAPDSVCGTESACFEVTVRNTGRTAWDAQSQIRMSLWQNGMDSGVRLMIPDGVTVTPGEEITFAVDGFQMAHQNSVLLGFQMVQEGVAYFGEQETVEIALGS